MRRVLGIAAYATYPPPCGPPQDVWTRSAHGRMAVNELPVRRAGDGHLEWHVTHRSSVGCNCADYANDRMDKFIYLPRAGFNPAIGRPVDSAFIGGGLHRETSNLNHKLNEYTFLGSFIDPQTRPIAGNS